MTNKDKLKNATQVTKGKVKEAAGKMSGRSKLTRKGRLDQVKGNIKQSGEKVKDAVGK
jgi:uncharacterized protein YjbJ (UPF0337 family)